eukprot:g63022.t1
MLSLLSRLRKRSDNTSTNSATNMEAALEAFRLGKHHVLSDFLAKYEGKRVDLSKKNLGISGALAVVKGLQVNNTVQTLNLYGNNIGPDGAKAIGKALEVNKSITGLNLNLNNIGPDGAAAIGKALEVNHTLISLYLGDNEIGIAGAQAIGEGLVVNQSIKHIFIQGSLIDVEQLRDGQAEFVLMDAPGWGEYHPNRLDKQSYDDLSATVIASLLTVNKTLRNLNLRNHHCIGHQGKMQIASALKINPTLFDLDGVELKDCFKELPAEVLQLGNRGILRYLRSLQSSGTRRSYQGKVVFLGDMGVGKTSLMHTLQGKPYQGTSTVGVDIQEWAVTHPDPAVKEPLTLSTWDFAGQEMYYSAHQLFLSRHSLFMLVWDPSTTDEVKDAVAKLNFWLKSIQARVDAPQAAGESKSTGQGAPEASKPKVFVVATRRDNQRPTPQGYEDEIRKLYSTLELVFYHVSNVGNQEGIEELRRDMTQAAASQKGMGQELARSWLDFRQAVLTKRESNPYVDSWTLLEQWAKDCKLEVEAIDAVLEYLHMCGSVLYFPEIGRLLITSPQWLSDVLCKVITHEQRTNQAQCGLLTTQKLAYAKPAQGTVLGNIWFLRITEYPECMFPAMLAHYVNIFDIFTGAWTCWKISTDQTVSHVFN